MKGFLLCLILTAAASGCTVAATDAGCSRYGEQRSSMPRPLGTGPLAEWVAVLDSAMTGACRK